eukprot:136181-Rhodomonas_salina.1
MESSSEQLQSMDSRSEQLQCNARDMGDDHASSPPQRVASEAASSGRTGAGVIVLVVRGGRLDTAHALSHTEQHTERAR